MVAQNTNTTSHDFKVEIVPIGSIKPSPENDDIYNGVDIDRDDYSNTLDSIRANGIYEPLQITTDDYILSGHRRHRCATELGLPDVPVIRLQIARSETPTDDYRRILAEFNAQRDKTPKEKLREKLAITKPKAHRQIIAERLAANLVPPPNLIVTSGSMGRSEIGPHKQELLNRVVEIVMASKKHWPISLRHIHYRISDSETKTLRNSSPGKQRATYDNDTKSSDALSDIATRGRIIGRIPRGAIQDDSRQEIVWDTHDGVEAFVADYAAKFTTKYYRDLLSDQNTHVEIVIEKASIKPHIERVAAEYTINVTVAKGKCSLPPREHVVDRWRRSGKEHLTLILLADLDPDGIVIADMWHKSLIGDLGVDPERFRCIRAGINPADVERFGMPKALEAKREASTYDKFVKEYGTSAHELDALEYDDLQLITREAIESVIDRDAYDAQVEIEEREAGFIEQVSDELGDFLADLIDALRAE